MREIGFDRIADVLRFPDAADEKRQECLTQHGDEPPSW